MIVPVLLVRLLPGVVGESRRVVHVVPVVNAAEVPPVMVAYCGQSIERGTAEVLPEMAGMPCERCVLATPIPNATRPMAHHTPRQALIRESAQVIQLWPREVRCHPVHDDD